MPKVKTLALRSTVVLWSFVLWSVLLTDFSPAQGRNPIGRQVVIATREVPPFAMKDAEGQWVGISIELLREIKADLEADGEQETKLGLVWMFAGLFIIASFTASVTSALTVIQLKSRISGPSDLSRVRVATVGESTSESYLRGRHIIAQKYVAVRDALLALKAKKVEAVVYDAPILQYEAHQHFPGEIHVLPMTFERQDYAFALPTDSPLRERINQVLLRKIGSPEWKAVLASFFGEQFEQ